MEIYLFGILYSKSPFIFSDMDKLQNCVVHSLEKCDESTPANLVESMFKFVRNETPCVNFTSVGCRSIFFLTIEMNIRMEFFDKILYS